MTKRGRKSAAELAVAPVVHVEPRPVAPSELTDEESDEWQCVIARMPAGYFPRETHGLLTQYCRHRIAARRIAEWLDRLESGDEFDADLWLRLQRAQATQSGALMALATKMRISHQARRSADRAATEAREGGDKPKPWESRRGA